MDISKKGSHGLWSQIIALQDWNQHFFKALQQFSELEKIPLGQDTKRGLKSMKRFANAELNWQDFAKSEANGEANDDSFSEMFCLTRDTFWLFHDDLKTKSTTLAKASKKGRKF